MYNGNISETLWQTANDYTNRWYKYNYDALNRILSATSNDDKYNVSGITYDKAGNILSLDRQGHLNDAASSFGNMDILSYTYDTGNKLLKVADIGNKTYGFKDGTNTNDDFEYDANGNMVKDRNKGIDQITYNHLNLPTTVTVSGTNNGTINYVYDATGAKLKKIATEGGNATTTEYAGGYIYKNGNLEYFSTSEGYVTPENGGYKYIYQFKDHLGNVRLSYTDADNSGTVEQSEIIEESNYYPFGLTHRGYNEIVSSHGNSTAQLIGYGGKEQQNELGLEFLDFGARNYDASIGRWMNIDPLADIMEMDSPYNYAFDNPVFFIDSNGMMPWPVHEFFYDWTRRVDSWYGPRNCTGCSSFHRGLDINFSGGGATDFGAPVLATHTGRVVSIKTSLSGAGRNVLIQSPDGTFQTQYFHMSRIDVLLGSYVEEGQQVGAIGGSGRGRERGYAVHLHYAMKRQNGSGSYDWYNPTGGKANETANIVDPQAWLGYGPWESSYYDPIAGANFSIFLLDGPIGQETSTNTSTSASTQNPRPSVTPIDPLPSGGIVPAPITPIVPGGGTIPPPPPPPNPVIIPDQPILD
ncbi:peptidoglycan DD-metalloendopeptidase family protein [Aquimarina sp. 2201CG1-2-11]|uniref:peptidoglycan DD-metalloendopeptidase family protein n=1 Tax=Aquimarina discodermiae TaxID=3231043 RepID=UPI00346307D7